VGYELWCGLDKNGEIRESICRGVYLPTYSTPVLMFYSALYSFITGNLTGSMIASFKSHNVIS